MGGLTLDQTFGFQAPPPYPNCCSQDGPGWDPDEFIFQFGSGGLGYPDINATDSCNGTLLNISSQFPTWESDNTSVALVSKQKVQAEGVGSTFGTAAGRIFVGAGGYCAYDPAQEQAPISVHPTVGIKAPAPTTVPVAQTQPGGSGIVGNHEVYISATCGPAGQVSPKYNWSITQGSAQVSLDSTYTGGPTMGIIGIKGGTQNGVVISVTCTDENTNETSLVPATATMTAQQPGSLTIVLPDNTALNGCPSGQCGAKRSFTYQVNDTNGVAMTFSQLDFWDYISTGSPNTCNTQSYQVTCSGGISVASGQQTGSCGTTTGSSGQFSENLPICSSLCGAAQNGKCTGTCSTQSTQTWIVNGYPITKSLTYQCNSVSVQ